ncbi:MAG TPA: HEAT repeat domain-containing protein [Kofleriaceae bacterium]|jgi:HEAT repeat protein
MLRSLVLVCGFAVPALAGPPRHGKLDLAPLVTALGSDDAEAAVKAADTLGAAPEPAAHEALLDALALGPPAPVAVAVLAALASHPAPPDVAALVRYAGHRNPQVRAAALGTLALYPDPTAQVAIVHGLHDQTGIVRGAAAAAAAKGHVRDSIDALFGLLAKGEEPAARALAQLADPDLARKIGDQLGHVPEATLALCLGAILKRADFGPDSARVEVVHALANISDQAAITALTDYIDATPKTPPRPSLAEASRAVEAKLGGGK